MVNRWHNREEGNFFSLFCITLEERCCEAFPNCLRVEWEQKLNGRSCEKRGKEGVYGAVDVVERKAMQETIGGCVIPGFDERLALRRQDRGREKNAFLFSH